MDETMNFVPTKYGWTNYRSRLEARYAAMFDLIGWDYEYEPIDLAGYIPDFILKFHIPLLFEVKGIFNYADLEMFKEKIERSGWTGEGVLAGAQIFDCHMIREKSGDLFSWDRAVFKYCFVCGRLTIIPEAGGWQCRTCGAYDGNKYLGETEEHPLCREGLLPIWREAGNIVRWKPGPP